MENPNAEGRIYNVVDPSPVTKKEYMDLLINKLYPKAYKIYIPYSLLYSVVFLQEFICKVAKMKPFLTRYRLSASQKSVMYDSSRIRTEVNWRSAIPIREGLQMLMDEECTKTWK
jgi:nucleoside-diphosphate-sugar epimerase